MPVLLIALQWLHVFFAIWWFGSILVTRMSLWPALRRLGPETEGAVRREMGMQRWATPLMSGGTVLLGAVRGAMAGAFDRLSEPYGLTYLAALVIGVVMVIWVNFPLPAPPYTDFWRRACVGLFPLMLTLMILMRFGY